MTAKFPEKFSQNRIVVHIRYNMFSIITEGSDILQKFIIYIFPVSDIICNILRQIIILTMILRQTPSQQKICFSATDFREKTDEENRIKNTKNLVCDGKTNMKISEKKLYKNYHCVMVYIHIHECLFLIRMNNFFRIM
jgi:hypothetical protein